MANIHLLLRVPSFCRWPLAVNFLSRDAHVAWARHCDGDSGDTCKETRVRILFHATAPMGNTPSGSGLGPVAPSPTYEPLRAYVAKSRDIFDFEREGSCIGCDEHLAECRGFLAVCPSDECEGVGHLDCWASLLLRHDREDDTEPVVPLVGRCPSCLNEVRWVDMMKEMTLRVRGAKMADKLLRPLKSGPVDGNGVGEIGEGL